MVGRVIRRGAPVSSTLLTGVIGFLLLTLMLGATAVATVRITVDTVGDLTDRVEPLLDLNADLLQALTDAESGERGFLVTGDERFLAPFDTGLIAAAELLDELDAVAGDDLTLAELLGEQRAAAEDWVDSFALPIVEQARTDREAAARRAATGEGRARFNLIRRSNADTAAYLRTVRQDGVDRIDEVSNRATIAAVAITVLAAMVAAVLTAYARREIVAPLARLDRAVTEMGRDGPEPVVDESGAREIRTLARAVSDWSMANRQLEAVRRRRTDHLVLSADLARRVRSVLDPSEVLGLAAGGIGEALEADVVAIWLDVDPAGSVAWTPHGTELRPPELPASTRRALDDAISATGVVVVDDIATDPRTADPETLTHAASFEVGAVLVASVQTGSSTMGTVLVGSTHPRAWNPFESELLVSVARELGTAVEHATLFERERQMVVDLQALDNARSEFVSSVSHELRTPLASIMGYAEMLRDGDAGELNEAQDAMLEAVDRNAARLLGLIEDLLIVARIEAGRFVLELDETDLATVLLSALSTVEATARNRALTFVHRIDPDIPVVQVDPRHLERVVLNLLSNAVKFTPDGGSIEMEARLDGSEITIRVTDSGLGIPSEELDQVFDRFYRTSVSRTQAVQGTGLGLAIARSVVEAHGGSISVASVEGSGSTFTVVLPIIPPPPHEESP